MKNNRKILALVLAVFMSAVMLVAASGLEIFIIASSDEYEDYATSAKYLEILDIMKGYEDGELHLEEPILRYQAALLFSRIVTGVVDETMWGSGTSKTYTDVPEYGPIMDLITALDIIRGYGNGIFGYNDGIRYQDMCAMFVRVLGYETEDMAYPMGYVLKVEELGFGLNNVLPGDYLNRGQVAQMIYDALVTEIAEENDAKLDAIVKIISDNNGQETVDETKDTYLERNFDVSDRMVFQILATENYIFNTELNRFLGVEKSEEGYFTAVTVNNGDSFEIWNFPIEGEAVNGVTEADLIGKYISVVFDDKTPTADEFDNEDIIVVHAEMIGSDSYENRGELSTVKFNEDGDTLYLGTNKISIEDLRDVTIVSPSTDEDYVYDIFPADALELLLSSHTYFGIEAYDFDEDDKYDLFEITPYQFGQYAKRRYSNQYYTMVGEYSTAPVYNISTVSEKSDANKTHFVEKFLVTGETAVKTNSYRPEDVTVSVGEEGRFSLNAVLTGKPVNNGDFVLYSYNMHTGEFCVIENLGTYQTGTLTGLSTRKQTYTIDGSAMALGLPGALHDANGLLVGEEAYESSVSLAKDIIADAVKGEVNVRFLEYDTKLVYLESYGGPAAVTSSDYVIVDIEASLEAAEEAAETSDEEAWDIIVGDGYATVKVVDPATGELSDITVESVTLHDNSVLNFKSAPEKHFFGTWADMQAYTAIRANGVLYYTEDEDSDNMFELYAYGSEAFSVEGAGILPVADGEPSVYFTYGKSNNFIDPENEAGIAVDRVATGSKTVSTIIGSDGYILREGALDTNSEDKPNELFFSSAALVLVAGDKQLTIFDPASTVAIDTDANVYDNNAKSIWASDTSVSYDGYDYYMLISKSEYVDSGAYLDENGDVVLTESGDPLYAHVYTKLYNFRNGSTEDVTVITTDTEPVFTEIENSAMAVLRVDAENYEAQATSFEEVFVENDIYRNATFTELRDAGWLTCNLKEKDIDKNGSISDDEKGFLIYHNFDADLNYDCLDGLTYKFIDLDAGADVDPEKFSFDDAYLFYHRNDSNLVYYTLVDLEDLEEGVDYSKVTIPIKRHYHSGNSYVGRIENGAITEGLTAGSIGRIYGQTFYMRNNWSDYLIPAVDENGETIWSYDGSLRVSVRYYSFAYYDEESNTLDAVVVRVGEIDGVIGSDIEPEDFIDVSGMPIEPPVDDIN